MEIYDSNSNPLTYVTVCFSHVLVLGNAWLFS